MASAAQIQKLNDTDKDISKLLKLASDALKALLPPSNQQEHEQLEKQQQKYNAATAHQQSQPQITLWGDEDPNDDYNDLGQDEAQDAKFVDTTKVYYSLLNTIQTDIRTAIANLRHERISPMVVQSFGNNSVKQTSGLSLGAQRIEIASIRQLTQSIQALMQQNANVSKDDMMDQTL
ncbi:hypothetical protein E3P99_03606 [Wallemia hederae]|uniref:Mediator of RNA polymerase II transcription subunit 11 n=1 Tax=Wallemia hederae TaxID=1540922 RepID=A0A4T0FEI8_9BASI|nr:hypothetical protein E3P99_03606 [Wallemia hederae]